MRHMAARPTDALTTIEAARILGVSVNTVRRLVAGGTLAATGAKWGNAQLSRAEVETLALARWIRRPRTADLYWTDTAGAARLLGVTPGRVRQLCEAGRLPFEVTANGARVFRREQLRTVGNARLSRRLQ